MIKRGQIFFADLDPAKGKEQSGRRPVLVVSDDVINALPLVVTVVVGTKSNNVPKDYPTNVRMSAKDTGLPVDTVFLCFQIRSLDPSRLMDTKSGRLKLAGQAPLEKMIAINEALKLTLSL